MNPAPPNKALQFLRWFCREDYLEEIEGDLTEVFRNQYKNSPRKAKWKFAWSVVRYLRPEFMKSFKHSYQPHSYGMYKSYFTIAWRTFLKNKGYTTINILGLVIGLTACLLITLYVSHELSYDRFNENADRIYRVNNEIKFGDNHLDRAATNAIFGETAKSNFPQIEQTTRLLWHGGFLVKKGDLNIREGDVAWADSTLFDVFTLPMISGDPKSALREPNSIVITESVALKYFDRTDVAGLTLTINNKKNRKITGVIKDLPPTCHFRFTCFIPLLENESASEASWASGQTFTTYLLLKPNTDVTALVPELNKMLDKHLGPEVKAIINITLDEFKSQGDYFKVSLTRLTDIHLHSKRSGELYSNGNIEYVYMFSAIAVLILIIACINFMNLATARSSTRAREVGVRKVLGSLKSSLIKQFITESFLTTIIAMLLAFLLTLVCLPYFNDLIGKKIDTTILYSPLMLLTFGSLVVIVGCLAGSYPAFYLSAFKPVAVLKGGKGSSVKKSLFRNALVVFQFSASVILISGTMVIYEQMKYIHTKDLGYSRDQILIINNTWQLGNRAASFKNSLLQLTGVDKATVSGYLPVNHYRSNDSFFTSPTLEIQEAISMQHWTIDEDYITTMGMQLVEGRDFSKNLAADSTAIIVNESAARFLGNLDIINKKLYRITDNEAQSVTEYHIVGIVKDFNFSTLRESVKPLAFIYGTDQGSLNVKINTADVPTLISAIERQWKALELNLPFEYSFMDEDFNRLYVGEQRIGKLFTVFAVLSIFVSCLGLFGLATFTAEQRTKEIGIRKVLGATVSGITTLLSKDFLKLVLVSVAIASPVAWYFMTQWLQGFAYRIDMKWWTFVASGMIAIIIAIITVSTHAIKAALENPVNSLRSE
jgi:putative ABC transport system permease protein